MNEFARRSAGIVALVAAHLATLPARVEALETDYRWQPTKRSGDWLDDGEPLAMPVRPADGDTVAVTPPEFGWPAQANGTDYLLRVTGPDGTQYSVRTPRNFATLPRPLEPGRYTWRVRGIGDKRGWSTPRHFDVAADARRRVIPNVEVLLKQVAARTRPRSLPAGEDMKKLLAQLAGPHRAAWEQLLARVRSSASVPVMTEPPAPPPRDRDYKAWAKVINEVPMTLAREVQRTQEAALAFAVTRDPMAGAQARRRALALAALPPNGATGFAANDVLPRNVGFTLSLVRDLLDDMLSAQDKKRLVSTALARLSDISTNLIGPARRLERRPYNSHGVATVHLTAAIAVLLAGEDASADAAFREFVPWFLHSSSYPWGGSDGGFANGSAYGVWFLDTLVPAWDVVLNATGLDLLESEWLRGYGQYLALVVPPGAPTNAFGDGAERAPVRHLLKRYFRRVDAPWARWYDRNTILTREDPSYLWLLLGAGRTPDGAGSPTLPDGAVFPSVGVAAMHSGLGDLDRTTVFFRSSPYGSFSHGHADQNSFVVYSRGRVLAADSGYYDYFKSPHWRDWYTTTRAHNAITYDGGQGQPAGRMDAAGTILRFLHDSRYDFVVGDATSAYAGTVKKAVRSLVYVRPGLVVVHDRLAAAVPRLWEWNLHTESEITMTGPNSVMTDNEGESLCVSLAAPAPLTYRQTSGFPVAPDIPNPATQYHGVFAVDKPLAATEFVAVLRVNCGMDSPTIARVGSTWRVTAEGHTVELNGEDDPIVR